MIDRYGDPVFVAWLEHELVWLQAAMTLATSMERTHAYLDIESMTGHSFRAIQVKASHIQQMRIAKEREARIASRAATTVMTLQPFPASNLNTSPEMQRRRMGARA